MDQRTRDINPTDVAHKEIQKYWCWLKGESHHVVEEVFYPVTSFSHFDTKVFVHTSNVSAILKSI